MSTGQPTVTGSRKPLGYQQISNPTAATKLTLPTLTGALAGFVVTYVIIQCSAFTCRWRDDGTAPTAIIGMNLAAGGELDYTGDPSTIQFINNSGACVLDVSFYG